jgi:thiol reductant ABC exporter CydC subunit
MRPGPTAGEPRAPLWRTLGIARPAARQLTVATVLGAGAVAAAIGLMGTSAWVISRASQRPAESALALAIVGVQFFALSRGLLRYAERLVGHSAAFKVLAELRSAVYRRLEPLAPTALPVFRRGDLLSRLISDVDSLQDLILRVIPPFAIAAVVGAATVAAVWILLPGAGLVLLVCLVVAATWVPWLTGALARRHESGQAAARGELTASLVDLIEGAPDLAVFGAMPAQLGRVAGADSEMRRVASASANTAGIGLALTTLLAGLATWGGLAVAVPAVHAGHLNGVLLAVIALIPMAAFELVAGLPVATQSLERSRRAAERVFAVMDAAPAVPDPPAPASMPDPPHELNAELLCARYPAEPARALEDVDLRLPVGKRVAIIGHSGAGKSALAAVLVRLLAYEDGSAALDAVELDQLRGDELRSGVGLVAQDTHLFDTTLAANLRVGRADATDEQLCAILRKVGLGSFLDELPNGLETQVGERGSRLSGGQRQRVAVARAMLAEFPVLILDEPAEHLDQGAADAMTADLLALTAGRSTVLITQRLAGLEEVDEIIVLDAGRVVERGTHGHLLAAEGRYSQLWWWEMRTSRSVVSPRTAIGSAPLTAPDWRIDQKRSPTS